MVSLACSPRPGRGDWRDRARCKSPGVAELFFADTPEDRRAAARLCRQCPVRVSCLLEELRFPSSEQNGFRGGLTAEDRRKLLQRRRELGTYRPTLSYRRWLPFSFDETGYPKGVA